MKNTLKVLGIIAVVAIIGFSIAACSDDSGSLLDGTWEGTNYYDTGKAVKVVISGDDITITYEGKDYKGKLVDYKGTEFGADATPGYDYEAKTVTVDGKDVGSVSYASAGSLYSFDFSVIIDDVYIGFSKSNVE